MSAVLNRERGRPRVTGNSQARAFTCTTSSGGKNPGSPGTRLLLKARQTILKEALAPLAHDLAPSGERGSDLIVASPLCCEQDHLRSQDFKIR